MEQIIILGCGIIGVLAGAGGMVFGFAQKKKFASPFLHKYPLGHPMSPVPDLNEVRRRAGTIYRAGVIEAAGIDLNAKFQLALLHSLAQYRREMPRWDQLQGGLRYRFDNFFFTGADAILLYSLLRHFKPKRVVEIGSGFSSALMLDTRQAFPEIGTEFTFIEPSG
ncbi:MAG: hypothetical protein P8107_09510 [Spirochaetia bacterium]